jgi:hypothetical protein
MAKSIPKEQKSLHPSKEWALISALILFLFLPDISFAGGPVHGAKAAGMGSAFVAIADDPSAIAYNPAGLTQLKGTNIYSGVTAVILSTEYEGPSGESEDTEFQVFFPPHLYISSDLNTDNMAVGLGVYSPFGIGGRKWSKNGPTQYTPEELRAKKGWGHSSWEQAIEVAKQAGVNKLALFHHDPEHNDTFLLEMEKECQKRYPQAFLAREGAEIKV